jgi:hypothetical protein
VAAMTLPIILIDIFTFSIISEGYITFAFVF